MSIRVPRIEIRADEVKFRDTRRDTRGSLNLSNMADGKSVEEIDGSILEGVRIGRFVQYDIYYIERLR